MRPVAQPRRLRGPEREREQDASARTTWDPLSKGLPGVG
jgi:hypothetical protein